WVCRKGNVPWHLHRFGALPYLGSALFSPHPLEAAYPQLDLPDQPFESLLAWLAEQGWGWQEPNGDRNPILTPGRLAIAFEGLINGPTGRSQVSTPEQLAELGDRTIHAYVLAEIQRHTGQSFPNLAALEAGLTDALCLLLVEQILPRVTVLDPACGSGRFLVMALHCLQNLYRCCVNYSARSHDARVQNWVQSVNIQSGAMGRTVNGAIARQIITQNLYGVDLDPAAIDITRTQLALVLLATNPIPTVLPPLTMNLRVGNSLIGFIQVDEVGFDQVPLTKKAAILPQAPSETALQGNLLQPLVADSYRTILKEKHLRAEEYHAQTQALAETGALPPVLQEEFLRDRLASLEQTAQTKLDQLLFNHFSQTLGIRVTVPKMLATMPGRLRRRRLTLADIVALTPFHWGFHYHPQITVGGFDIVLTQPPQGTLRPSPEDFYQRHQHHFEAFGIDLATFKTNRQDLLRQHSILAQLWVAEGETVAYSRQYFRCSPDYALQTSGAAQKAIYRSKLFSQRCAALTQPQGITAIVEHGI
ncbi:MAG: hypothetical protein HC812_15555, partial [Leptolyngbya sp. RL_3_1]|nr:hypothetical protein [Leptolyngbya sp. RL_3_1]